MILLAVVGMFLFVTSAFADTFDLVSPVYVSANSSGLVYFKSDNPTALNAIEGLVQFRNDIMKRNGTGRNKNAYREAVRVNPNLLTIQLYEETLNKQFAFNIKNGALWGQIPSCNLIPDGVTVVIEDSSPVGHPNEKKDSENGEGGYHLSAVAHLSDGAKSKLVNPIPVDPSCGGAAAKSAQVATTVAPAKKKAVQYRKNKATGKWEACDQCQLLKDIKADTTEIKANVRDVKSSVGMPDANEPADEKTLQQKARKTLDSVGVADATDEADEKTLQQKARKGLKIKKEIHKAVGTSKSGRSLHDKLGESKRPNGQLIPVIEEMHQDIKDIKAHMNIPADKLNNCAKCHNDTMPKAK